MTKSRSTALFLSAVVTLFHIPLSIAQVEIVDISGAVQEAAPTANQVTNAQGELFYQLQLLQEEIRTLRGMVEDQGYQLRQLQEQSMQRYIDLDRRIGQGTPLPEGGQDNTLGSLKPEAPPLEGEKSLYDQAYQKVVAKEFDAALEAFKAFLEQYPEGKYTPNSFYWLGELYQVVNPKDLEASRQSFIQLLERYPDHGKVPDAMYKLGKVYFLKGNKAQARQWLDRVIVDYGGTASSAVGKARQFIQENF